MNVEKMASVIRKVLAEKQPVTGYMNRHQAGKYIGSSGSFIQKMKDEGKLDFFQPVPSGTVRYTQTHLDDFMRRRESKWWKQ